MLSPNSSDRFASATEVMQALKDISLIKALTIKSQPVIRQLSTSKNQFFSRLSPKTLLFALLTGTVLLGSFWWWKNKDLATVSHTPSNSNNSAQVKSQLSPRFSQGEKVLIPQTTTPKKIIYRLRKSEFRIQKVLRDKRQKLKVTYINRI